MMTFSPWTSGSTRLGGRYQVDSAATLRWGVRQ